MAIFAVNEGLDQITGDVSERVISLLEWQRGVRGVLAQITGETLLAKNESAIFRALHSTKEGLSRSALYKRIHGERFGLDLFKHALTNLTSVTKAVQEKGGKIFFSKE